MSLFSKFQETGSVERFDRLGVRYTPEQVEQMMTRLIKLFPSSEVKNEQGFTHPGIKGFELAFRKFEIMAGLEEHQQAIRDFDNPTNEMPMPFLIATPLGNGDNQRAALAMKRGWRLGLYATSHNCANVEYLDTNATTEPKELARNIDTGRVIVAQSATIESPEIDFPNQWYGWFDDSVKIATFSIVVDGMQAEQILERYEDRAQIKV